MPDDALPPDEPDHDKHLGDDVADDVDEDDGDNGELVIKLDPAVRETLSQFTQPQSAIFRQAFEPITSAWAESLSKSMLAGIDTSALQAFSKTVSAALPKFELPMFELPPLIDLLALTGLQTYLSRIVSGIDVGVP